MLKQIIAIIALSVIVIIAMPYMNIGLHYILSAHDWISNLLTQVFAGDQAGNILRKLIALLAAPIAIGLIPTVIYWLARKQLFPYFMEVVLIFWVAQTSAIIILHKAV